MDGRPTVVAGVAAVRLGEAARKSVGRRTSSPERVFTIGAALLEFFIGTGTNVKSLVVKVDVLTGAQLQDLIKKLPDGMTYELGLEKEEG